MEQKDPRIDEIIEVIQKIASGDYTSRISIGDTMDELDGICTGINMLSEEVENLIKILNEENERLQDTVEKLQSTSNQLSESEEIFSKIFRTSPDSMIISRLHDGLFIDINDGFCDLTGYTRDEVIGKKVFELGFWLDKKDRDSLVAGLKKKGIVTNLNIRFRRKDKQIRDTLLSAIVIMLSEVPHMLTITRDITELKNAEREITEAKERYENLVATAPDGILVLNLKGHITMINKAFEKMSGYSEKELLGVHLTKFPGIGPKDIPKYVKVFANILKDKTPEPLELIWHRKDGELLFTEIHSSILRKDNKIIGGLAVVRDITDRVRDREALEISETQYRTSMDALEESIHVVNKDLEIVLANQSLVKLTRATGLNSDIIGEKYYDAFPFLEESVKGEYLQVFKTGEPIRKEENYMIGGQAFYTNTKLIPIFKDKKVELILTVVQDITERKEAELVREIMNKISSAVNLTKDMNELSQVIRDELGQIFDTTNFFIALHNKDDDTLALPYFVDEKDSFNSFPAGKSLTGYVIRNDMPLLMNDKDISNLVKKGEIEDVGTPSKIWLGVPLKIKEEIIGALVVQSYEDENAYSAQDLEMLKFVSNQIGLSIETKRAHDDVQVEKAYFEQLFESSPEIVVLTDNEGKLLRVNHEFEMLFKYNEQEAIGRYIDELIVPPELTKEARSISTKVARGEKIRLETVRHDKFGNRFHVSLLGTPVEIEGGQVGVYGIYRDITPQKKSQLALVESEEKLRNILYSSPDPITVVDLRGNITEANLAAVKILGYNSVEEIIGTNALAMVAPGEKNRGILSLKHVLRKGSIQNEEFELNLKNKKKIYVELSASIIKDANERPQGIVAITKDITERKEYEHNLKIAKEKAEQSDKLKSAFLANMSHEIRTPMNAILGFSELLKNEKIQNEERDEYIKIINNKGNELLLIINDIIDISKIEAGDIKIFRQEFEVNPFLRDMYNTFNEEKNLMSKEQVQLRLSIPEGKNPVINSDQTRIQQILSNLLNNALKFTEEGFIELGYRMMPNKTIEFYVQDSGIGIPKDKHAVIFDRFRQADESVSSIHGGTGLGLAISKNLVNLLGGEICLESEESQGSEFQFILAYSGSVIKETTDKGQDKQKPKPKKQLKTIDLKNKRILVVEDDSANYLFIESFLKRTRAEITWAKDGVQAIDLYKDSNHFDMILMDIRMPRMNGIEAIKIIRKKDKQLPIIALTAYAFANDREKALQAGCNGYLAKPVKVEELQETLIRYFT